MAYYTTPSNYNYGYYPALPQVAMQQPMQMVPQQLIEQQPMLSTQMPGTSLNSYFIWVQGEAGAKSYPVARGTTVPLFDSEGDYVYFKSVDTNGVPLPLVKKVISDPPIEIIQPEEKVETPDYVTKDVYEQLKKQYDDLELRIMELETRPAQVTSNFTGNTFNNNRKGEKDNGNKFSV